MANAQLNIQFVEYRLGNENLVYNNYKYRIKSQRGERCNWRCVQSACPVRINALNRIPVNTQERLNHPSDPMQLNIDKLPATRQDINLEGKWRETITGNNFLLIDDGDQQRILIFSTDFNLTHLTAASTVYGDSPFYSCPTTFYQLYTLHAFVHGTMYPLVFALLPGKGQATYTRFFQHLNDYCLQHQLQLQPETIFLDYETVVHNAASTVFPGITKKGCIWRKACKYLTATMKKYINW
ncbi:hypothetical protein KUTeg_012505 [Tegillarca granosa]|uniref:MULE transposase domain-containing protein n=1 Tax=Tegillarca granosa TaxID=220873 RepID=A0ABQ9EZQ3_TEGGR|nr:hypothetical protein KUTeg_012505 [Tegillarca granosa]